MQKDTKLDDMRVALALLEEEMRRLNWWQKDRPGIEALSSPEPFCADTLTFSEWLQWVYRPKMTMFMNQNNQLPSRSGLKPIAEEAWKNVDEDTARLFMLIEAFDNLVRGEAYFHLLDQLMDRQ